MLRIGAFAFLLSTAAFACGCAGAPAESPPLLVNDPPPLANDTAALSGYQLTDEEKKYDCKKLTGKMQVRILQMRGYDTHAKASSFARTAQAVTTPIFGGTKEGMDPDGQYRRDRAMLDAYNRELAAKKCKTFDIEAELKKIDGTPEPIPAKTKQ